MKHHVAGLLGAALALGFVLAPSEANALSVRCSLGFAKCVTIDGAEVPVSDAERIAESCADFTRNNVGRRVVLMSQQQILQLSGGRANHPLILAMVAYDSLHDSALPFDRSLPMERRYSPVKRACGHVFRALRIAPPEEAE